VERMKTCDNIKELAKELKIHHRLLYCWKYQFEGRPEPRHANYAEDKQKRAETKLEQENQRLKVTLANKTLEVDFFKGALRRIKEGRRNITTSGASASTPKSTSGRNSSKAN
jgi:molybdopterin-guanine dinucleotide biosynthesis protein A